MKLFPKISLTKYKIRYFYKKKRKIKVFKYIYTIYLYNMLMRQLRASPTPDKQTYRGHFRRK